MARSAGLALVAALVLGGQATLHAAPILQIYVEGGVLDEATNSWLLAPPESQRNAPFRLWVIGNVDGPGGRGVIEDVRLVVAYSQRDLGLTIRLAPSQVGRRNVGRSCGVADPSISTMPELNTAVRTSLGMATTWPNGIVSNGGAPVLVGGTPLAADGVFGLGTVWQEFSLGDLSLTDSPVADLSAGLPTEWYPAAGQINVYEVSVVGGSGAKLYFDVYGKVAGEDHSPIASVSDLPVEVMIAPEPASILLWCLLGLTWAGSAWTYHYLSRGQKLEQEGMLAPVVCQGSVAFQGQADATARKAAALKTGRSAQRGMEPSSRPLND